jgi:hypothetical protein
MTTPDWRYDRLVRIAVLKAIDRTGSIEHTALLLKLSDFGDLRRGLENGLIFTAFIPPKW